MKISNCDIFHLSSRPLKAHKDCIEDGGSDKGYTTWKSVGFELLVKFGDDSKHYKFGTIADLSDE